MKQRQRFGRPIFLFKAVKGRKALFRFLNHVNLRRVMFSGPFSSLRKFLSILCAVAALVAELSAAQQQPARRKQLSILKRCL